MPKTCTACGATPIEPEFPPPPKGASSVPESTEADACPNCGETGTMEEVAELPTGEDDEE